MTHPTDDALPCSKVHLCQCEGTRPELLRGSLKLIGKKFSMGSLEPAGHALLMQVKAGFGIEMLTGGWVRVRVRF